MCFAVNGFISSTTRAHVSAFWVSNYKIYSRSRYSTHLRSVASQQTCHCIRRGIHACGCQENCDEGEDRGAHKEGGCQSARYPGLQPETGRTRRRRPRIRPNEPRTYTADSARNESATLTTATRTAADFNRQLLEMARSNTNSTFDFARRLIGMQSPSGFMAVSVAHARKQFESFNEQARQLATLAQEGRSDPATPRADGAASSFSRVPRTDPG
jgi:hypothetical protein